MSQVALKPLRQVFWHAFWAIAVKETRRYTRIWIQTLVPPAITMTLYFLIFGHFIGSRIPEIDGVSYMAFIVPGIVMMAVITSSYANVTSSFFGAKMNRYVEEMLVAPVSNNVILMGFVCGGVGRGLLVGLVVLLIALCFTSLPMTHWLVTLSVIFLTAVLFALGGFINAVYAKKFDDIAIVPNFVLTPITYLGGVFYSLHMLPPFWRSLSHLNPVVYMVNAFRYGMVGVADVPIGLAYGILLLTIAVFYLYAWRLLRSGVGLRG